MRKMYQLLFCITMSLLAVCPLHAQETADTAGAKPRYTQAYIDSLLKDPALMKELGAFMDSMKQRKSMLVVAIGGGNGFFTARNATTATGYNSRLFTMPSISYYHKSGFGISGAAYATNDNNKTVFYQGVITPSFDIIRDDWSVGVSYSRYFNNDSVSFALNPLKNDVFVYGVYKKGWLQPGIALDYSFARYKETKLEQDDPRPYPNMLGSSFGVHKHEYKIEAADFSMIGTLQHDFNWMNVLHRTDRLTFTPTLMVLASRQNYAVNVINQLRKENPRDIFSEVLISPTQSGHTKLAIQSLGGLFNATYSIGHLMIQPQVMGNYVLKTDSGVRSFHTSFLMTIGLVF